MPHFLMFEIFEISHFPIDSENGKTGAFQARDQFQNRKGTENEILRFFGISK